MIFEKGLFFLKEKINNVGSSLFHDMLDYVSFLECKSLTTLTEIPPLFSLLCSFFHFDFVPPLELSAPSFPSFWFSIPTPCNVFYSIWWSSFSFKDPNILL